MKCTLPLLLLVIMTSCATLGEEAVFASSFTLVPGTVPEMNTPGYWITRTPDPDRILMSEGQIAAFNLAVRNQGTRRDLRVAALPTQEELQKDFREGSAWLIRSTLYFRNGKKVEKDFYEGLVPLMAPDSVPAQPHFRYGFTVKKTDFRVLPTTTALHDAPGDWFSDNLQISALDPGVPFLILHETGDGAWLFGMTEFASGWIQAQDLGLTEKEDFFQILNPDKTALVLSAKAEVWADPARRTLVTTLRMGSKILLSGDITPLTEVMMPQRSVTGNLEWKSAFIRGDEISRKPLEYTSRNVINQAFQFLNSPYGWGGMFGEQDCSQFLMEVFATLGLELPRNSSRQALVGTPLPGFSKDLPPGEKARLISTRAIPGAALPRLSGHIVLYLGTVDGRPYVLHSTWAYRENRNGDDVVRLINRVVVSDLDLGAGSRKGSLLQRLLQVPLLIPGEEIPADQG